MRKYILYFACLLAFSWGCNSNKADNHSEHNHQHDEHDHSHDEKEHDAHNNCDGHDDDHDHTSEKENIHADEIIFTAEQAKMVGLELETVQAGDFSQVIKTSGQILAAIGDEVTISATNNGIVSFKRKNLNEGVAVRAGEALIGISSQNIVDGDPIQKAKVQYDIAKKEYDRANALYTDKLISEKEYNEIRLSYENAKIALGNFSKGGASGANASSSISGYIKERLVEEGQYVEIGQPLMVVTQNKRLRLRADVPESSYKYLSNISSANFKASHEDTLYKLSELNGKVISYARSVSNQSAYLPISFEFDNVGQVIPGSYVEVYLISNTRSNVISVPIGALTEEQGLYFVYIQLDAEGYKKQEVKLGASDGERVEILSGLKVGDIVVSKGAVYVKLASASSSIPHAHEH